ncbi:MAG: ParA family protein [Pseudomonadota bacterium]
MPVLSFANAKGGAGKTTAALLVATDLMDQGYSVSIVDADPQRWISQWAAMSGPQRRLAIIDEVSAGSIDSVIREERDNRDYILVDLEGAMSPLVSRVVSASDLVLVPIQGCAMDAKGGGKVLDLIADLQREEHRTIRHSVILTRINAAVTTRALRAVRDHLLANRIDVLTTPIVERSVSRDIFETGGSLFTLDPKTASNLDKAIDNVRRRTTEIITRVPARRRKPLSWPTRAWLQAA